jgi:hypothetical protein
MTSKKQADYALGKSHPERLGKFSCGKIMAAIRKNDPGPALLLEKTRWHCIERQASPEERGTERNSFNIVFGARPGARPFFHRFALETQFAGRSKAQAYCLALEDSPFDRSHA